MTALGMALVFASYTVSMYGYTLVRGYNVTFVQLVNPRQKWISVAAYEKSPAKGELFWPPVAAANTAVIPTGQPATKGTGVQG